jgi:hypothetical protein
MNEYLLYGRNCRKHVVTVVGVVFRKQDEKVCRDTLAKLRYCSFIYMINLNYIEKVNLFTTLNSLLIPYNDI